MDRVIERYRRRRRARVARCWCGADPVRPARAALGDLGQGQRSACRRAANGIDQCGVAALAAGRDAAEAAGTAGRGGRGAGGLTAGEYRAGGNGGRTAITGDPGAGCSTRTAGRRGRRAGAVCCRGRHGRSRRHRRRAPVRAVPDARGHAARVHTATRTARGGDNGRDSMRAVQHRTRRGGSRGPAGADTAGKATVTARRGASARHRARLCVGDREEGGRVAADAGNAVAGVAARTAGRDLGQAQGAAVGGACHGVGHDAGPAGAAVRADRTGTARTAGLNAGEADRVAAGRDTRQNGRAPGAAGTGHTRLSAVAADGGGIHRDRLGGGR